MIDSEVFAKRMVANSSKRSKELVDQIPERPIEGDALLQTCTQLMWNEFVLGVFPPAKEIGMLYERGGYEEHFDIILGLADQIREEVKHSKLFARRVEELGGNPNILEHTPNDIDVELLGCVADHEHIVPMAASLQCTGEVTLATLFTKYIESGVLDERTERYFRKAEADEGGHINNGKKILERFATTEDLQRQAEAAGNTTFQKFASMYGVEMGPIHTHYLSEASD